MKLSQFDIPSTKTIKCREPKIKDVTDDVQDLPAEINKREDID